MRAFVSIHLPDSLKKQLGNLQQKLRPQLPMVRWISAKNSHLTLKFLGDIREEDLPRVDEALRPIAEDTLPFTMEFQGIGQFPPRGALSVLWVGIRKGNRELVELEKRIRKAFTSGRVPFDGKPFSPHITLGRIPRGKPVFWQPPNEVQSQQHGSMPVEGYSLMQSHLHPKGAVHTEVIGYELNPRAEKRNR